LRHLWFSFPAFFRLDFFSSSGADRLRLKGEVTREEFLALASNKAPGKEEKPHGPDKGKADGGLRLLLLGSEVGLGVPGAERRPGGGTDDQ